jgi:hypothetical protein
VLMDPRAKSHIVVGRITRNVIRTFLGLDPCYPAWGDASIDEVVGRGRDVD